MMLTRCHPNHHRNMSLDLNRFFGDFANLGSVPAGTQPDHFHPAVDIHETEDEYRLQVELPGVKKDAFKLSIKENVLTLGAEKKLDEEVKEENVRRKERAYGSFHRSFTFAQRIDAAQVSASYTDGVLEITVPKAEEAKPRTVEVAVG